MFVFVVVDCLFVLFCFSVYLLLLCFCVGWWRFFGWIFFFLGGGLFCCLCTIIDNLLRITYIYIYVYMCVYVCMCVSLCSKTSTKCSVPPTHFPHL